MFGVMRLTFEREGGSIKGDEDFFSVARTMPFVAISGVSRWASGSCYIQIKCTFDSQCRNTLIDGV
jgi:hypothetical protein